MSEVHGGQRGAHYHLHAPFQISSMQPAGKPAGWLEHYLAGYSPHSESHFPHKKQRDNFTPAAQLPIFPVKIGGIIPGRVDLGTPTPTFHVNAQRDNF